MSLRVAVRAGGRANSLASGVSVVADALGDNRDELFRVVASDGEAVVATVVGPTTPDDKSNFFPTAAAKVPVAGEKPQPPPRLLLLLPPTAVVRVRKGESEFDTDEDADQVSQELSDAYAKSLSSSALTHEKSECSSGADMCSTDARCVISSARSGDGTC